MLGYSHAYSVEKKGQRQEVTHTIIVGKMKDLKSFQKTKLVNCHRNFHVSSSVYNTHSIFGTSPGWAMRKCGEVMVLAVTKRYLKEKVSVKFVMFLFPAVCKIFIMQASKMFLPDSCFTDITKVQRKLFETRNSAFRHDYKRFLFSLMSSHHIYIFMLYAERLQL